MNTLQHSPSTTTRPAPSAAAREHRLTLSRVVRSELLKLLTVRSVLATLLSTIPIGLIYVLNNMGRLDPGTDRAENLQHLIYLQGGYAGVATLIVTMVGVLSITSEHANGQIGSTLRAVPHRWTLVLAKSIALGTAVWTAGFITTTLSALIPLSMAGPLPADAPEAIFITSACSGLAWAAIAIIGLGIGGLLRSAAFSIATAFSLYLILPNLLRSVPEFQDFMTTLPTVAVSFLASPVSAESALAGGVSLAVWATAAIAIWGATLSRRDI